MNEQTGETEVIRGRLRSMDIMAVRALAVGALFLAVFATGVLGQQGPDELTLEEAIALAKTNNPTFLSTQNDQASANWQVREAYASFIPSVRVSGFGSWQEAGAQRFGTIVFEDQITDWAFSGYNVNFGMTIDGNTIFGIGNSRANRRATETRISSAEFDLESLVGLQYMTVLRAQDGVDVAQRQLDRAEQNLEIVQTRVQTGAVAGTDGRQAEVDFGRAEVGLIQAERDLRRSRMQLSEQLGISLPEDVALLSAFEVFEPDFDLQQMLVWSMEDHPSLQSFRAQESATRSAARQASTGQYLPSINLSASLSGQAQQALNQDFVVTQASNRANAQVGGCEFNNTLNTGLNGGLPKWDNKDCSQFMLSDADREAALASNQAFPFNFTTIPMRASVVVSLPIFTGFSRERQVSQANNIAEDAEHSRRAEELRLQTMVTNAYDNLVSTYRVVQAEGRNRTLSEEQLLLQQRRYALGAVDLLVLMDAQTTLSTSDQAYLDAVYEFHYSLIVLEAAVGRPLGAR
jgi:outer membrane protein